jgi:O-antigen/teichoic acid export membrane protein
MLLRMSEESAAPGDGASPAEESVGKKILAGGTWRMLAYAFSAALGVVMTAVISRALGPADFALFVTAMSLVTIALSLSDVGLLTLGIREYAAQPPEIREINQRALIGLRLITSAITSTGIVVFAIWKGYPKDLIWGLIVAGFGICGLSLCISYSVPLQATYRLGQVAALEAGRQALQMSLMMMFALLFANVGWLMAAFLPTGVVLAAAAGLMSRKLSSIKPSFDLKVMRSMVVAAGAFAVAAAISTNYAYVAQIVSNSAMTSHESGMFGLAFRVFVVAIAAFSSGVGGAFALLVTAVTEGDRDRLAFATRRLFQSAWLAGVGGAVAFIAGAGFVVAMLGGREFEDAIPVVATIGLALPGSYVVSVAYLHLMADRHYKALIIRTAIGAMASIVATALLADAWGPLGAATGIIVGETVLALACLSKSFTVDRRTLPKPGWAIGVLAIGAVSCAPALLPLPSLVNAMLAGTVFLVLAVLFRAIPPELLHPVKSRLGFAV